MNIPLVIGRNSSGDPFMIDLSLQPNLFISYNEEEQLIQIFKEVMNGLSRLAPAPALAIAVSRRSAMKLMPKVSATFRIEFTHSDPADDIIKSIDDFILALINELKLRKRQVKSNVKLKLSEHPMIVFLDDIFEVIMAPIRKTALSFIELLVDGPDYSIHFITGSSGIYKNLLDQLTIASPAVQKKMAKTKQREQTHEPLAAQLIINPDGLVFFKGRRENEFVKMYSN